MSDFQFGYGSARVSDRAGHKIDRVARKHGARFVWCQMPEGWRYWFTAPNKGAPFDEHTKTSVLDAVKAAGLVLP